MHDRVTICGGVLGGHPRLVADEILALSVANCRSTWRWRDGSSARMGPHEKARCKKAKGPIGRVRDHEILSARPAAYLDLQSRFAGFTQQRCLRQRHGADRAPARAARNGCAASKTRLTTCEAQTAMASSHRAASWIEGQCSPTDVDVGTVPARQVC